MIQREAAMRLATGVDLIEIDRLERTIRRQGDRFLERVFTPQELADCASNLASLAARWAAKEAVAKALGTGIGAVRWREIEILRGPAKQPVLRLHDEALKLADAQRLHSWSISLSHTDSHAIALVVALGEE